MGILLEPETREESKHNYLREPLSDLECYIVYDRQETLEKFDKLTEAKQADLKRYFGAQTFDPKDSYTSVSYINKIRDSSESQAAAVAVLNESFRELK